ncbi:MAG: hypothetical protein KDC38_15115 [Planctomycetes bacterium]|nr:hypothetical protein [Planctomycetota bacterium]
MSGWRTVGKCRRWIEVVTVLLALAVGPRSLAQSTVVQTDPVAGPGSSAHQHVVRDSTGGLHLLSIFENGAGERELRLYHSTNGGSDWSLDPLLMNDDTSGLIAPNPTNVCAIAIDSQDRLHLTWASYYYPSNYQQYYRQVEPGTSTLSAIVDVSAITGAVATNRTAAMEVTVDSNDTVWLVAHAASSWVEHLLQSDLPFAADLAFSDVGAISPSASAQNSRIAIDTAGRVHCSFYRNTGSGNYEHRIYEPGVGWGASTVIGDTTPTNDFYGSLAADALGNVHALIALNTGTGDDWLFQYRRWDEVAGWDAPVDVMLAPPLAYDGIANYRIFALACDETTGRAQLALRDLVNGGPLVLLAKELADAGFSVVQELRSATLDAHAYYLPTIRGTLYPENNRTGSTLDLTWQERPVPGVPPYELRFQRVGGGAMFRRGDVNDDGLFDISDAVFALASLFIPASPPPTCVDAADANDDDVFDISDPVYTLAALFIPGSLPPPAPGPAACGSESGGSISCDTYTSCP